MPSFVPRYQEPTSKILLLAKRQASLARAIRTGANPEVQARAAEQLRRAALAVHKGWLAILQGRPVVEGLARRLANLAAEDRRWRSLTTAEIIAEATPRGG